MIIQIQNNDLEAVKKFLESNNMMHSITNSPFECFLENEIASSEMIYEGVFHKHTLDCIAEEVREDAMNMNVDIITNIYNEKVAKYIDKIDMDTIAVYTISNTVSVELKSLDGIEYMCTYNHSDVYIGELEYNEYGIGCVRIGEMLLPINEFVRV